MPTSIQQEMKKKRLEREKKKLIERQRKEEEARKAKELADKIRRRQFPMDDLRLIEEDKELGVNPPEDVTERPSLPCLWTFSVPFEERGDEPVNTSKAMISSSRTTKDASTVGNRGLVSDLFQVYHFFTGDAGFNRVYEDAVAPFSLCNLKFAVNELVNGNARAARIVPPLISHMFVTALKFLVGDHVINRGGEEDATSTGPPVSPQELRLRADLAMLEEGLNSGEDKNSYMLTFDNLISEEVFLELTLAIIFGTSFLFCLSFLERDLLLLHGCNGKVLHNRCLIKSECTPRTAT